MKKHLKSFLFFEGNKIAESVLVAAALSNAEVKPLDINLLFAYAMSLKLLGRDEETQVEKIHDERLHIDAKINGKWENVLIVQAVTVVGIIDNPVPEQTESL